MFSIENPPTDPPCPQLKPCNARASHKRGLPETDLSKPAIFNEASLPKFSIRDYVLSSRGKDIKTNWPFSPKTLHLCLKHGVKDLLPPFQPPSKVRTQPTGGCSVDKANLENPSISNFDGEPSPSDRCVGLIVSNLVKPNEKHSQTCIDSNLSRCEGGNDLRSTTTSLSPSEIGSIPTFHPSNSPVEFGTLSKAPVEAKAGEPIVSVKSERTVKLLGKKCRITIKHRAHANQASCEDFVSNCTSTSETMASKTCPVCRIFSSPSNTTLNAHIDQCLSTESTPKWSLDSKTTKYKFKPRKTKLMVDIYVTASPCTLEDLDRRNGTTWALGSRLPTADVEKSETHYEGNRERASLARPKATANQGEVYIDSKGTKLRILSVCSDVSLSRVRDSLGSTMEDEGKKLHSPKRKKCHVLKYQKVRKLAVQRKTISPSKDFSTQIDRSYDGYSGAEEDCNMDKHHQKPRKSHDSGCLRQWIRAKRTGIAKKVLSNECHQNLAGELLVQTDQSCLVDMNTDKFSDLKGTNTSEDAMFSPENVNNMETECPSYDDQILERNGRSSGRKKPESPSSAEFLRDIEALPLVKENGSEHKKGTSFSGDRYLVKPPNCNGHYMALSSKKGPNIVNRYSSDILLKDCHATALKASKFNSLSEKMCLLSKPSSIKGSKSPLLKKHSALKKSRTDLARKIDETMRSFNSETCRISGMPNESFGSRSKEEQTIEGIPKSKVPPYEKGQLSASQRNETMGLTSLSSSSLISNNCDDENFDSVQGGLKYFDGKKGVECAGEVVQSHGECAILQSCSKLTSLTDSSANIYEMLNNSMTGSGFLNFSTISKQPVYGVEEQDLPTKLKLVDQPESISMEDEARALIRLNIDPPSEMHSETSPANSFDPILIPGPPGSFLPSPGEMQSEDFQGNSSLTTSQIHSSQDQQGLTDGASSDSPISTSSTFSTFLASKSDLNYFPAVHPDGFETKSSSVLSGCNLKPPREYSASFGVSTSTKTKNISDDRESLQVGQIFLQENNPSFTNGEKLCCCQKKEKIPPWVNNVSYRQRQLLKYRSFPSVALPCCKQKMGYNLNRGPDKFDPIPEILPLCSCNRFENVTTPGGCPPEVIFPFVSSPKAGVKSPNSCNFESTASSSKPVLRLMGKNLMVMNNNEDTSPRLEQPKPQPPAKNVLEFPKYLKNSSGQPAHKGFNLFHQDSSVLDTDSCNHRGRHFDNRLLDSFRANTDLRTSQSSAQRPAVVYTPNQSGNGYYTTSMQPHKHRYNHRLAPHDIDKNQAKGNAMRDMGELMSAPHSQQMNSNSGAIPVDGHHNCVPNMIQCVSTKYSDGFEFRLKLTPGI